MSDFLSFENGGGIANSRHHTFPKQNFTGELAGVSGI
jgi:hypothetical protein